MRKEQHTVAAIIGGVIFGVILFKPLVVVVGAGYVVQRLIKKYS